MVQLDFWGNVWEWTSTVRSDTNGEMLLGVKGGISCISGIERRRTRTKGRTRYACCSNSYCKIYNPKQHYVLETNLVKMLGRVTDTSAVMYGLESGSTHAYIVQPISYTAICDNVSGEYSVEATCMSEFVQGDVNEDGIFNLADMIALQQWLLAVPNAEFANWKVADFYEDDCLNVFDLCVMKQVLTDNH